MHLQSPLTFWQSSHAWGLGGTFRNKLTVTWEQQVYVCHVCRPYKRVQPSILHVVTEVMFRQRFHSDKGGFNTGISCQPIDLAEVKESEMTCYTPGKNLILEWKVEMTLRNVSLILTPWYLLFLGAAANPVLLSAPPRFRAIPSCSLCLGHWEAQETSSRPPLLPI